MAKARIEIEQYSKEINRQKFDILIVSAIF
jgi:hypothetical protein